MDLSTWIPSRRGESFSRALAAQAPPLQALAVITATNGPRAPRLAVSPLGSKSGVCVAATSQPMQVMKTGGGEGAESAGRGGIGSFEKLQMLFLKPCLEAAATLRGGMQERCRAQVQGTIHAENRAGWRRSQGRFRGAALWGVFIFWDPS
jgi:hypothetical protein